MSMNKTFSMPNLPGMIPNTQSWLYREREGFKKGRPESAATGRGMSASASNIDFSQTNLSASSNTFSRPATAGSSRLAQSLDNLKQFATVQQEQQQGYIRSRPSTAGPVKSNTVSFGNDTRGTPSPNEMYGLNGTYKQPMAESSSRPFTPLFVEKDKQVARFYGHFFQDRTWERDGPLGDPVIETHQCRRVTMFYYLVDDTIEISEPKTTNSGMPEGTFFRRAQLNNSRTNQRVTLRDLAPGNSVFILGQEIFITDADTFTRDYFRRTFNITLPPARNRPPEIRKDLGAQFATGLGAHLPVLKTNFGTRSTDYMVTKEILEKTNKFLKHDGKVLRFQCVEVKTKDPPYFPELEQDIPQYEPDEDTYFYDRLPNMPKQIVASANAKRYALSYFLTTNSIELVVQKKKGEKKGNNQGEPNLILKKSKLPRNWRDVQRGRPAEYYETMDFKCGGVIDVFGRYFLLVNCDRATRQLYGELGVHQQDVPLIEICEEKIEQPIPQLGDGFLPIGSNEDTLATVYGMPKVGKDIQKIQRNQNRLIRCKGVLLSNNAVDSSREFMITFFLEDDTIQVYEEVKRNSGIWGGNFLKRGRYINDLPNNSTEPRYFLPSDIYLGNVISFHGNEFQIVEMDNMSLKFCENYPDEFPMMDTFKVIGTMVLKVMDMQLDIRPIFKGADKKQQGWIDQDIFIRTLDGLGLIEDLNDQELLTLMRRFKDGDTYIYPEMCDLFSHVYHQHSSMNGSIQPIVSPPHKRISIDFTSLKTFLETARGKQNQWRRTLRKDPHTKGGFVTLAVLTKIFHKYTLTMTEQVQRELYSKYRAPKNIALPILKELENMHASENLFVGLDQKVVPKMNTKSLKKDLLGSADHSITSNNLSLQQSRLALRKQSTSANMSVLRKNTAIGIEDSDSLNGDFIPAAILIDYNKLCDDIYICDWC